MQQQEKLKCIMAYLDAQRSDVFGSYKEKYQDRKSTLLRRKCDLMSLKITVNTRRMRVSMYCIRVLSSWKGGLTRKEKEKGGIERPHQTPVMRLDQRIDEVIGSSLV